MAWRFHEHILRGELDNRVRGRVTGRIWLAGAAEPLALDLAGDCAPDLAGCMLTFENPQARPMTTAPPATVQRGWVGDITASQKVKVPEVPIDEFIRAKGRAPWHWANALYLEWFSESNGRVVVQTADFTLKISAPAWTITDEEYRASREACAREFSAWIEKTFGPLTGHVEVVNVGELLQDRDDEGEEWKRADRDEDELLFDPAEDAEWASPRAILVRKGFTPLPPEAVDGAQLRGRLWDLIYALAARRIFLSNTDHLADRALYKWLDAFLDEDCADCPPDAETNYHVDVSGAVDGSDAAVQTWLRFFADEAERADWLRDFPETPLPPRERPPHDRDRFLPEPPGPLPEWIPPGEDDDPSGVDSEIRIENLKDEIAATIGGEITEMKSGDVPPAVEEAFLEQVRDLERDGWQRPIDELAARGAVPLPPSELTDETIAAKLWELLHNLACRGFYALHTDHLSDRELYAALWDKGLREEAILPGRSKTGGWFHDFIGSGSDEDIQLWLRHYANADDRNRHARDYPDEPLPPHEDPPHRRDWRLPKGPF